jgi:chemotaxis signal transduction protein
VNSTSTPHATPLQLLRLYLGDDCYCVDTFHVTAIRRWEEALVEGTEPDGAIASLRLGNRTLAVYSLAERLGIDTGAPSNGPIVVIRSGRLQYAIQVDRVSRAAIVAPSLPRQLPLASTHGRLRGSVQLNGELALYLSAARLVGSPLGTGEEATFAAPAHWPQQPPELPSQRLLCLAEPGGDTSLVFGFTLRQAIEIASDLRVIRVSSSQPCLIGVAAWREYVVPVVDPCALLGLPSTTPFTTRGRMGILRGSRTPHLFAIPAASFATLLPHSDENIASAKPMPNISPYVRAAFDIGGECLVLPDLDCLTAPLAA